MSAVLAATSPVRGDPSAIFLNARLTPHRSLGSRGFTLLMIAIATLSFLVGFAFWLLGAWPVFGFCGLDVLLIFLAFRANYRAARAYEAVTLTDDALTVRCVDAKGGERSWAFEPTWLRVEIDDPPEHDSLLTLASHGRELAIGAFLTPHERKTLAQAIRQALQVRRAALVGQAYASSSTSSIE